MSDLTPHHEEDWAIKLITGTTAVPKAVAKLIDTVGDQIGLFLEPKHIRGKGQAEADVMVAEAKAKAEIAVIRLENKIVLRDIQDRAEQRVKSLEARRQVNLEDITAQAAKEIPESVSEEPVDDDWMARFFESCQDVSNEQMQVLWARILAGEVAKPGAFSLRTLATARTLSRSDADLFTHFCSIVWLANANPLVLYPLTPLNFDALKKIDGINLNFDDFVRLDSLGLIRFEALTGFNVTFSMEGIHNNDNNINMIWRYYGKKHIISKVLLNNENPYITCGKALLTDIGKELVQISGSAPNEEYRRLIISEKRDGWEFNEILP